MKKRRMDLEPAQAGENEVGFEEEARMSAAERLGREMLDRLGADEETDEDELADAIIEVMTRMSDAPAAPEKPRTNELPENVRDPFGTLPRMPVPMKTGSVKPEPADYSEMSVKQFNELKKLLKKANADGKRIRL